jgi:hypothetical protein
MVVILKRAKRRRLQRLESHVPDSQGQMKTTLSLFFDQMPRPVSQVSGSTKYELV